MNSEFFKILNNTVDEYLIYLNASDISDFMMFKHMNNIVLENGIRTNWPYFKNKISLKKNINIANDFLSYLNIDYQEYFHQCLKDKIFIFDKLATYDGYSMYNTETKKRSIYVPITNSIKDSFVIVHELMHDINSIDLINNGTRLSYTEALSLLSGFLLEDYLKENKVKDAKVVNTQNLIMILDKSIEIDFNLKIIEKYLEHNYIDITSYRDIYDFYPSDYYVILNKTANKILNYKQMTLNFEMRYIIGILIATYMYDRTKQNKKNILELFDLNEIIKSRTFDDVLDYLDLEYDEFDLKENSYHTLKNKYIKYVKSR